MSLCQAMAILRTCFDKYAGKDGDKNNLSKAELSQLLKSEGLLTGSENKADVEKFFGMLDKDKDGVVDFQEFVTFAAALSVICCGN